MANERRKARTFASWKDNDFQETIRTAKETFKLAVANGCFDLLHDGHIHLLEQVRLRSPDCFLVVAVNTDASVRRLKGPDRPIIPFRSRSYILSAIRFVDVVVGFEEDTPVEMLQTIKPDFLVKGDQYTKTDVIGAQFAKEVWLMPTVAQLSTTYILEQIRDNCKHGKVAAEKEVSGDGFNVLETNGENC